MATRKSGRAIDREPMAAAGARNVPAEAATATATRARARNRHDMPVRAPAPEVRPALRLVKSPRTARQPTVPAVPSPVPAVTTTPRLTLLAAPATQLPLRFPHSYSQPLLPLPSSSLSAPIEHAAPPAPRRARSAASGTASASMASATAPASAHPAPLRQPHTHPARPSVRACFGELREALAEGYEIVQPIFARPLWSVSDDSTTAFNFVLRRELTTRLVTVPEGRTVQRFIRERQLLVDYRR